MNKARWIGASLLLLALAGCGYSPGTVCRGHGTLYYDLKDAENGGPSDLWFQLSREGKAETIGESSVEIVKWGSEWSKVKVISGDRRGASGWIDSKVLAREL